MKTTITVLVLSFLISITARFSDNSGISVRALCVSEGVLGEFLHKTAGLLRPGETMTIVILPSDCKPTVAL